VVGRVSHHDVRISNRAHVNGWQPTAGPDKEKPKILGGYPSIKQFAEYGSIVAQKEYAARLRVETADRIVLR
jgi:hypothetical protein